MKMKDNQGMCSPLISSWWNTRGAPLKLKNLFMGPILFHIITIRSFSFSFPFNFHFHSCLGCPLPCLLTYFLLFFSPTSFFFSSSLDLDSFFPLMAAQTHGFGFLHHALLLLFMLMVFWPFSDFNTWFTAAQEQQAMHEGKIRANQSETIENRNDVKMIPVPEIKYMPWAWENDKNRRKLAPFQLCSGCTCCGSESNKSICTTSACCYSITCGLPDKPYGVCAFTPKACDCTNCGV